MRRLLAMALALGLLASCAGGKPPVEPAPAADTQPAQFSLPEAAKPAEAKPAPKLDAVLTERDKDEQYIILNFENTDIRTIISTFAELLEMNYILTPGVSGGVTIQSYKRFPVKNLFAIFQSILEVNGLTAVKDGDFYHIMPIDNARVAPMDVEKSAEIEYRLDGSFVTQLVPLQNVKAADVANNILRNLLPRGVNLIIYEPSNMLIITARPNTLAKFMKIVDALDVTGDESNAVRTFVYYVENGEAKKLQEILRAVYFGPGATNTTTVTSAQKSVSSPFTPATGVRITPQPQTQTVVQTSKSASEGDLPAELGDVTITAYEDINALIIKASPRGYLTLLEVLRKVDVPPRQVLIDVMIAEVSLTDKFEFGLEWLLKSGSGDLIGHNPSRIGTAPVTITPGVVPPHPGNFGVAATGTVSGEAFSAILTALGSQTELNVLASPNILAMDNKEAEIKIGNEIPVATGRTTSSVGSDLDIQYKTVGTILTVTPHITEKGNVSMKISVESSDTGGTEKVASLDYPKFSTRKATTTAVVENNQTLFLGGLIYDKASNTSAGIPWLSKIPLIGWLFGGQSYEKTKTELLLMVTPHVIKDSDEARELTSQYQTRVKRIQDNLSLKEEKPEKSDKEKAESKTKPADKDTASQKPAAQSTAPLTAVVPQAPAKPSQPAQAAPAPAPAAAAPKPSAPAILAPAAPPAPTAPAQQPASVKPAPAAQPAPSSAPAPVKAAPVKPAPAKPAQVKPAPAAPTVPSAPAAPAPIQSDIAPRTVD